MTQSKKMIGLVGILLAVVLIYILISKLSSEKEINNINVSDIKAEDIEKISWTYSGDDISVLKKDGKWILESNEDYPVNQSKMDDMADTISATKASNAIKDADISEFGLDTSEDFVAVSLSNGEEKIFIIGEKNRIIDKTYIMLKDENTVYTVDESFALTFNCTLKDLLAMENIPYLSDANEISITKNNTNITLKSEKVDNQDVWKSGDTELDYQKVENIKVGLNSMAWSDCVEYKADDNLLAEYGFSEPYAEVMWKNNSESIEIEFGNKTGDGAIYARIKNSNMIYTMNESVEEYLVTDINQLLPEDTEE